MKALRKLLVAAVAVGLAAGTLGLIPLPAVEARPATRLATIPMPTVRVASAGAVGTATPVPLSHLAVRWSGDHDADVEVRWATAAGWQPWQRAAYDADTSEGSGLVYSTLVRAADAVRVDARVVSGPARDIAVVAIDTTHA